MRLFLSLTVYFGYRSFTLLEYKCCISFNSLFLACLKQIIAHSSFGSETDYSTSPARTFPRVSCFTLCFSLFSTSKRVAVSRSCYRRYYVIFSSSQFLERTNAEVRLLRVKKCAREFVSKLWEIVFSMRLTWSSISAGDDTFEVYVEFDGLLNAWITNLYSI